MSLKLNFEKLKIKQKVTFKTSERKKTILSVDRFFAYDCDLVLERKKMFFFMISMVIF